jgi:hypothetical protein
MFEELVYTLSSNRDIFPSTDPFGQSLIAEVLDPMIAMCASLAEMAGTIDGLLAGINASLAEIRSMEG